MTIGESELQRIGDYVKGNLNLWLGEVAPQTMIGPQLLERMIRVEEELKAQRDLMKTGFESANRRFEDMNNRLEDMNKRFNSLQWLIGAGLVLITVVMSIYEFVT